MLLPAATYHAAGQQLIHALQCNIYPTGLHVPNQLVCSPFREGHTLVELLLLRGTDTQIPFNLSGF